jgi:uncharacterized protein (TIGR00369 family)
MSEYLQQVALPGQQVNLLFGFLGVEVETVERDFVQLRLPLRRDFLQGAGVVAGGIISTLLDEAMAHAVITGLPGEVNCPGVEISVKFLRPVIFTGEQPLWLTACGRIIRRGRKMATAQAEAFTTPDKVCAISQGTFLLVEDSAEKPAKAGDQKPK